VARWLRYSAKTRDLAVAGAGPQGCLRRREDVNKLGEQLEQRVTRSRAVNTDAAATRTDSDE
jgi:hypothetical protein